MAVEAFHRAGIVPRLGHREHKRLRHQATALVHNHAIIVLRNLTHHRNEQTRTIRHCCAGCAQQTKAARVHERHSLGVVHFPILDAVFLLLGRAVTLNIAALKFQRGFRAAAVQILAGHEYHHLLRGLGGLLVHARCGEFIQGGGIGHVVELVQLHI